MKRFILLVALLSSSTLMLAQAARDAIYLSQYTLGGICQNRWDRPVR